MTSARTSLDDVIDGEELVEVHQHRLGELGDLLDKLLPVSRRRVLRRTSTGRVRTSTGRVRT